MNTTRLETARLVLRAYQAEDRDTFVSLNTDDEVRRHMDGALPQEKAELRFDEMLADKTGRRTCWAIIEKETGAFAGHVYLETLDGQPLPELGILFFKSFWSNGLATEMARRLTGHCFHVNGLRGLIATVDCDHTAAIRVLEKVVLKKERVATDKFGPFFIYSIQRMNSE